MKIANELAESALDNGRYGQFFNSLTHNKYKNVSERA